MKFRTVDNHSVRMWAQVVLLPLLLFGWPMDRSAAASLEDYAALPSMSLVDLSPSGGRVAMRNIEGGRDFITIFDLASKSVVNAVRAENINPRDLEMVNDDDVLVFASEARRALGMRGKYEFTATVHFDARTGSTKQLLKGARDIYELQSGLGTVVGAAPDGRSLFMPAAVQRRGSGKPTYGLFRVTLATNEAELLDYGNPHTIDWFVNAQGRILAREDFDDDDDVHSIWALDAEGEEALVFQEETPVPRLTLAGVTVDERALVAVARDDTSDGTDLFLLDLDGGGLRAAGIGRDDTTIDRVIADVNRRVSGVAFAGLTPRYRFFDRALDARVATIQKSIEGAAVELVDWSEDFDRLLFHVSGSISSGIYALYDGLAGPQVIGQEYPRIKRPAPVSIVRYAARDGLEIPALLTTPIDADGDGPLPLIVLPHGGPRANDELGFDWLAQYLASLGALVLQPQFRGSTGQGVEFTQRGFGEWGGAMSTDLDDGVRFLVDQGRVDPDRVCMVGASYGGYAALAAGAFSDFPYRCLVSIGGLSDLADMLLDRRRRQGESAASILYWELQFGASRRDREALEARSPVKHAERFQAPVLLLHGRDDTVVNPDQSRDMERALKRAKKPVDLKIMRGEDHWLTQPETRLETLERIDDFLREHLL